MTKEHLRELWEAEPFRAFKINFVDGKETDVPHPDYLFFVPESEIIFAVNRQNGKQRFRFLTADQIASTERDA